MAVMCGVCLSARYLLNRTHTGSQKFRDTRLTQAPECALSVSPGEPQLEADRNQPLQGAVEVTNTSWVGCFPSPVKGVLLAKQLFSV